MNHRRNLKTLEKILSPHPVFLLPGSGHERECVLLAQVPSVLTHVFNQTIRFTNFRSTRVQANNAVNKATLTIRVGGLGLALDHFGNFLYFGAVVHCREPLIESAL